jgi:rhodanese-related sulfurtransferase
MTRWHRGLAIGLLLAAGPVLSQTVRPGSALPDALRDVKPSTGICRRDDFTGPGSAALRGAGEPKPDLACRLGVDQWARLAGEPQTTLVDVRSAPERELATIDGALQVSAAELARKPFLKDKTLVLLGNGKAERELYAACSTLKASGFRDVRVLQGGMPAWLGSGRPVLSRHALANEVPRLSAPELWLEGHFDANLVLVVPGQARVQAALPQARVIGNAGLPAVQAALAAQRKATKNRAIAAVVLVVPPELPAADLLALRSALAPLPLLVYADGADAYAKQMKQQQQVWTAQARGPKQPACGL